jgi:hypothetical protein
MACSKAEEPMTRDTLIDARRDELLTVGELAKIWRCSQKSIYRRIWANQQPGAIRIGGQWRIDFTMACRVEKPRRYTSRR